MENSNTMTDRTCEIMDYIYKSEKAVGVSNIATNLNLPKATVFRILVTLEKWNFVEKNADNDEYHLGIGLIKYGAKVSSEMNLVDVAKPIINALSIKISESVNLNIEHQNQSLNVYKSPNDNFILVSKLTPISPLNCSSSGKIFLSQKPVEFLKAYFDEENYSKLTMNSITNYSHYMKEYDDIINKGFAYDNEEYEYGLFCIASPVYHQNKIVAAVSVSGPKTRLEYKGIAYIETELKRACSEITKMIEDLEPYNL